MEVKDNQKPNQYNFSQIIDKFFEENTILDPGLQGKISFLESRLLILKNILGNKCKKLENIKQKIANLRYVSMEGLLDSLDKALNILQSNQPEQKKLFLAEVKKEIKARKIEIENLKQALISERMKKPPKKQNLTFFSAQKDNDGFAIPFAPTHKRKIKSENEDDKPVRKLPPIKKSKTVENAEDDKPKRPLNSSVKKIKSAENSENEQTNNSYQSN